MSYRIGTGIDYHQLQEGIPFWIGGIEVPHHKGAKGHSDADVLLHAICDALLGALALGDIGQHFPDTDNSYKGIDSKILLEKTIQLIHQQEYVVVNVDSTLSLQAPKIAPYLSSMRACIAEILHINVSDVSIKATTTEKLGFIGREEGVMAQASVLLKKKTD